MFIDTSVEALWQPLAELQKEIDADSQILPTNHAADPTISDHVTILNIPFYFRGTILYQSRGVHIADT